MKYSHPTFKFILLIAILYSAPKLQATVVTLSPVYEISKDLLHEPKPELLEQIRDQQKSSDLSYSKILKDNPITEEHFKQVPVWFVRYLLTLYFLLPSAEQALVLHDLADRIFPKNVAEFLYGASLERDAANTAVTEKFLAQVIQTPNRTMRECKKKCNNVRFDELGDRLDALKKADGKNSKIQSTKKLLVDALTKEMQRLELKLE